jgi:hypothetical protein
MKLCEKEGCNEINEKVINEKGGEKEEEGVLVVYDTNQNYHHRKGNCLVSGVLVFTAMSFRYIFYEYILKYESQKLLEDIQKLNKRFISNTYSRVMTEFNIFMLNSIEINMVDDITTTSYCFLSGVMNFSESQSMLNELMETALNGNQKYNLDFFVDVFRHVIRKTIGLGPSLLELKKYVIPDEDLRYNVNEKSNLRGYHSALSLLRETYETKMSVNYGGSNKILNDDDETNLHEFVHKVQNLVFNPEMLVCNSLTSGNKMNIKNFRENFAVTSSLGVKDLYNTMLDVNDGIISVRVQNALTKTCYLFVVGLLISFVFIIICQRRKKKGY